MPPAPENETSETHSVRLSFRSTVSNFEKLVKIAKAKGWLNAQGKPNVSAVLNYVIEKFEDTSHKEKKNGR